MQINTHLMAHGPFLGTPIDVVDDTYAVVQLVAIESMVVDEKGLIHGGFTFGLADYAAMLAINHPNVVIGAANVRFTAPVIREDIMLARAVVDEKINNKRIVKVEVKVENKTVLTGDLTCYILDKHVLEK